MKRPADARYHLSGAPLLAVPMRFDGFATAPTRLQPLDRNMLRYHPSAVNPSPTTTRKLRCIEATVSKVRTSPTANTFLSEEQLRADLGAPDRPCCILDAVGWPINLEGRINSEGTGAAAEDAEPTVAVINTQILWWVAALACCLPFSISIPRCLLCVLCTVLQRCWVDWLAAGHPQPHTCHHAPGYFLASSCHSTNCTGMLLFVPYLSVRAVGRRRELNVTIAVSDDPSYAFSGTAASIKLPEMVSYKYLEYDTSNTSTNGSPASAIRESHLISVLYGTAYVLSNSTDASGQRLQFTMSKCIADGNALGFCERLRSSTSPLFIA